MTTNTNIQQNPLWEAILKNCGANAINVADSYYNKVTREVGDSLDKLRKNTVASITAGIKASFAIASAVLISSLVDASSQLAGAYGSGESLKEINPAEKEFDKADQSFKKLDKEEKELLKKPGVSDSDKAAKTLEKEKQQKVVQNKEKALSNKSQKASAKAQMISGYATAAATIPKSLSDAFKTKGEAINSVLQQLVGMLGSTYSKSNETLKSFFDIDYLGGLVALGQIQLR